MVQKMKAKISKHIALFACLALLLVGLVIGGTLAILHAVTETKENQFSSGVINITIDEEFYEEEEDSYVKKVRFCNDSLDGQLSVADNYIRAKVVTNWVLEDGSVYAIDTEELMSRITIDGQEDNWVYNEEDGCYYYTEVVAPDQYTTYLFQTVTIDTTDLPEGHLEMNVLADAIQIGDFSSYEEAWEAALSTTED